MITTLRNPLELFVSALQFKNREDTRTLNGAVELASQNMQTSLRCVLPHLHHAWYAEGSLYEACRAKRCYEGLAWHTGGLCPALLEFGSEVAGESYLERTDSIGCASHADRLEARLADQNYSPEDHWCLLGLRLGLGHIKAQLHGRCLVSRPGANAYGVGSDAVGYARHLDGAKR